MIDGLAAPYGNVEFYTVEVTSASLAPFSSQPTMKGSENGTSTPDLTLTNGVGQIFVCFIFEMC